LALTTEATEFAEKSQNIFLCGPWALVAIFFVRCEDFARYVGGSGARPRAERRSALRVWLHLCRAVRSVVDLFFATRQEVDACATEIAEMLRVLRAKLESRGGHGAAEPQWKIPDSKFKTLASRKVCQKRNKL
jgi:hypothetical protein